MGSGFRAYQHLPQSAPGRARIVSVIDERSLPHSPGHSLAEPAHVVLESLPAFWREVPRAFRGIAEGVHVADDLVGLEIADEASRRQITKARLDVGNRRALVESGVPQLVEILGADVVVVDVHRGP